MKDFLNKEQKLLIKEAGLSSTCIGQGLTILRRANFVLKWNYYQGFFLISIGIERLLKLIIISKYRGDNNGDFPKDLYLRSLGHDIGKLVSVVEAYDLQSDDEESISDNIQLDIIEFFTEFSKGSRYYNLDAITGSERQIDPLSAWKKIQDKIVIEKGLRSEPLPQEFHQFVNSFALLYHHDEDGKLINDSEHFFQDSKIIDKVQGYSIFHIWNIIQILTDKLRFLESSHHLYPCLGEFFPYFIKDWNKYNNVRKRKNWNYLK